MSRSQLVDLSGQRFGRLIAIELNYSRECPSGQKKAQWSCVCDCGNSSVVSASNLKRGNTISCGCFHKERTSLTKTTHGHSRPNQWTKEYAAWAGMIQRCHNPKNERYSSYGGRGIKVCAEWRYSFDNFLACMGLAPGPEFTLGRIRNNDIYRPNNCEWQTREQQSNNKRSSKFLTANGQRLTISQWSKATGIKAPTIGARVRVSGWTDEMAVTEPVKT